HAANAGFTERLAGQATDGEGRTTYAWLADLVDPARHTRMLDLACGSGRLSSICHQRFGSAVRIDAVDMSAAELSLARARLPTGAVRFHHALAQDLAFLPAASVDVVLCHWALTLMDPITPVLREVRRVLAPGGVFGAIVDGDPDTAPVYGAADALIFRHVQRALPNYGAIDLGDPRVRSRDALERLTRSMFDGASIAIEPNVVQISGEPLSLAAEAAGFYYAAFMLADDAIEALHVDLAALLAKTGRARFEMPVNRLIVRV
ncbi:MAG: class I SAM-dependent methyltransferase, partial [Pseudomonadota bacterium]